MQIYNGLNAKLPIVYRTYVMENPGRGKPICKFNEVVQE